MSDDQTSIGFPTPPEPPVGPDPGVRLEVDSDNVGWVVFDLPGEKVNKLTTPVMERLRALLDQALRRNVRGLGFVSAKPDMFVAGADVEEIGAITDPKEGAEKAAYGQAVFEAVANFPRPTIAVITGPCLGGGYELALACDVRLAEKNPRIKIGLPEVKLGIVPGFGGTQRLPKRVGIRTALDIILAGKTVPAKVAFRKGMIDALVPTGEGRRVAGEFLRGERSITPNEPSRTDRMLVLVPFVRDKILDKARQALAAKVRRDHYPAPFMALHAVAAAYAQDEVAAYRKEARLLGEAVVTPQSKSLVWLFRNSSEAKTPRGLDLELARKPRRTAVLGAGVMGGGIAWLAAEGGLPIRVKDIRPEALQHALATAGGLWAKATKRRRITKDERDRRLERLSYTLDYSGFRTVDFVFEAVIEDLNVKHAVIEETEAAVSDDTVIASNTSSLRIGDIAHTSHRPGRVTGLHFFNPVDRMPLVEVIAGPRSEPWAVATTYKLALDLGKTPILVKDGPGFLVNRLLAFYLGEALALLEDGADPQQVDRLLVEFGMPMGPFSLLDQIGLDVADKVTKVVKEAFGERLAPSAVVARLSADGHHGRKTGSGFYVYKDGKPAGPAPEAAAAAGRPPARAFETADILDRCLLPMVNEAARCLEEGVVARPLDVDLGMVMGTGFPPFRGGLLRWADDRGVTAIVERLDGLASVSARFQPSAALRARRAGFYATAAAAPPPASAPPEPTPPEPAPPSTPPDPETPPFP